MIESARLTVGVERGAETRSVEASLSQLIGTASEVNSAEIVVDGKRRRRLERLALKRKLQSRRTERRGGVVGELKRTTASRRLAAIGY